tara:strand:+ start:502 stop:729 length:228 start_codon:yes stop_codon:yes gene_type:complete
MQKNIFHNNQSTNNNISKTKLLQVQNVKQKKIVDINKLLNRVRVDKKNEMKKKVIFFSSIILTLSLIANFILFIK